MSARREPGGGAPRSLLRSRAVLAFFVLVVIGLPAVLGTAWMREELRGAVTSGEQPGGLLRGRVVDAEGAPLAGRAVESVLFAPERSEPGPRAESDARGEFALELPPWQGHYLLRAGGGTEQRAVRPVSFLGPHGEVRELAPLELVLRPGAILELSILHADDTPAAGGRWVLEGTFSTGGLLACVPYGLRQEGTLEDGRLHLDGLPPMRAGLSVVLDTGETLDLQLEIHPGFNAHTLRL